MALSVFIVDDHTLVRSGIRALIEAAPDLNVVGEASDGREAVEQIESLRPELVLMDVAMSGLNGIDAARQVHASLPDTRIIMLSMHEDRQYVFEALKAGATGYVLKSAAFQDLIVAIEVTADATDHAQLVPMVEEACATTGTPAEQTVADAVGTRPPVIANGNVAGTGEVPAARTVSSRCRTRPRCGPAPPSARPRSGPRAAGRARWWGRCGPSWPR